MNIFDKIYNCWEYAKCRHLASYYMVMTFFVMLLIAVAIASIVLPIALTYMMQSGWWLLLIFITIPLVVGAICKLDDWMH